GIPFCGDHNRVKSLKTEGQTMNYDRKRKEDRPVLAICYDFDKTLSPDDMQAQGYIQSVGYDVQKFWDESNDLAKANDMDNNLAYMWKMVQDRWSRRRKISGETTRGRKLLKNIEECGRQQKSLDSREMQQAAGAPGTKGNAAGGRIS
ncbi:hypothetical protein OBE_11726, partial [human gut metagenome]